jgi:hypothetical protein
MIGCRVLSFEELCTQQEQLLRNQGPLPLSAGTHDTFIEDDSVLFVSTHQANTFPFMGALHEVGTADGSGYSINLPLPGAAPVPGSDPSGRFAASRLKFQNIMLEQCFTLPFGVI